jgi:chorismate mutase
MSAVKVRAIRGATTVALDGADEIYAATRELLAEMLSRNEIPLEDIISVLFTTSPDLVGAFPATAARSLGFADVPLMCASEIAVPGALGHCIRIMMHVHSELPRANVRHVYLRDAVALRSDLV